MPSQLFEFFFPSAEWGLEWTMGMAHRRGLAQLIRRSILKLEIGAGAFT
jgi:hypothetical protein